MQLRYRQGMAYDAIEFADRASPFLKIMSGRLRFAILLTLRDGEASVGDIVRKLGVRDAAVSQQLAVLRSSGTVSTRRSGQLIYYSIASDLVEPFIASLLSVILQNNSVRPS